jgi:hypothetical protein
VRQVLAAYTTDHTRTRTHAHTRTPYAVIHTHSLTHSLTPRYRYEKQRQRGIEPRGNQKIRPEQIALLEKLGFQWTAVKDTAAWERKFDMLVEFQREFGSVRVDWRLDTPK